MKYRIKVLKFICHYRYLAILRLVLLRIHIHVPVLVNELIKFNFFNKSKLNCEFHVHVHVY